MLHLSPASGFYYNVCYYERSKKTSSSNVLRDFPARMCVFQDFYVCTTRHFCCRRRRHMSSSHVVVIFVVVVVYITGWDAGQESYPQ